VASLGEQFYTDARQSTRASFRQDACQPYHRNLNLFTAAAWLSLARQDAAIENVIAGWNTPKVPEPRMPSFIFQGVLGWFRQDRRPIEHVVR